MLLKVALLFAIAAAAVARSALHEDDADDIPVYTEKVTSSKPTATPKFGSADPKGPRFGAKKARRKPSKAPHPFQRTTDHHPFPETTVPQRDYPKTAKPIRRRQPKAPRPTKAPPLHDYAPAPHDPAPLRATYADYEGYASRAHAGNAPRTFYAPAPDAFRPAPAEARAVPAADPYSHNSYEQESPQPYAFGYELQGERGSTQSRREEGDARGHKRGSYGYTGGDGLYRRVDYVADERGFRAVVHTNEPGTDSQDPADVHVVAAEHNRYR